MRPCAPGQLARPDQLVAFPAGRAGGVPFAVVADGGAHEALGSLVEAPEPFDLQARVLLGLLLLVVERLPEIVDLQLASAVPLTPCSVGDIGLANALPSHFHLPRKNLNVSSSDGRLGRGPAARGAAAERGGPGAPRRPGRRRSGGGLACRDRAGAGAAGGLRLRAGGAASMRGTSARAIDVTVFMGVPIRTTARGETAGLVFAGDERRRRGRSGRDFAARRGGRGDPDGARVVPRRPGVRKSARRACGRPDAGGRSARHFAGADGARDRRVPAVRGLHPD